MFDESVSPYKFCKDLQYLIHVTLENIIIPLRKERKRIPVCSEALNLEIQDAEVFPSFILTCLTKNKTLEYLAQQISAICKADENVANHILREYPKSEACFTCLGVNDDTIQLLDMPDEDVSDILQTYGDPVEDIDHVLSGLSKIRSNIDLIENGVTFEDDTRNLIKLVLRLTKEARDESTDTPSFTSKSEDQKIPPLFVTGPELPISHNRAKEPEPASIEGADPKSCTPDSYSDYSSRKISSGEPSEVLSDPADLSMAQSPASTSAPSYGSQSHSLTNYYSKSGIENYSRNFDSVNLRTGVVWDRFLAFMDGGLSVPSTPILNGKSSSAFLSPTSCKSNKTVLADDLSPPSPRFKRMYKHPGTPPPKYKLKYTFPLHRSKSHESNLANRVPTPNSSTGVCVNCFGDAACRMPSAQPSEILNCTGSWKGVVTLPDGHLLQCLPPGHTTFPCFDPSRRISFDARAPRTILQPPTVMTTSVDGENTAGPPSASPKNHALSGCQVGLRPAQSSPAFQGSDPASAASSCASSTPGSPFAKYGGVGVACLTCNLAASTHLRPSLMNSVRGGSVLGGKRSPTRTLVSGSSTGNHFDFHVPSKETLNNAGDGTNPIIITQSSVESENTLVDAQRLAKRLESMDSQDDTSTLVRVNSISVTLKEWDIPVENVLIGDLIGHGTFGTVYRGKWHGEVAVKRIHLDPEDADGSERLEGFKREVALLHKTRHENVVLFMGACMKPPDLAIVTQLCQGYTLYHQLHVEGRAMGINRKINIACQIAKGMGYLHAKEIVHRDLKTRNIFIEAHSRVLIGDSGVFNFVLFYKKAKWGRYLNVPPSWLCYLAPEILHAFNFHCTCDWELPMTCSSDVFAFGTVWYELLTSEFPFKGYPAETLVYLCGRGVKPNLRIPVPKDFKELLVHCWAYSPSRRPGFTALVKSFDRLPKLHRSPSYPSKPTCGVNSDINPMTSHDGLLLSATPDRRL